VTAAPQRPHIFSRIRAGSGEWAQLVDRLCNQLPALFAHNRPQQSAADSPPPVVELPEFVATALAYITAPSPSLLTSASSPSSPSSCAISDFFSTYEKDLQDRMTVEHRRMVEQLFDEIHSTDIYRALDATDTASRSIGGGGGDGGEVACCRISTVHDDDGKKPTTTTASSSSPAAIPGEMATLILFLLLRQLDETKHHPQQPEAASSSSTSSPAPACSSCTASRPGPKQQQQEPHDGCERAGEVRFGESVAAAFKQLDALPLVSGEVGYLWASFRNIAFFCACRDRRTPCH
jgi:hypothetical protein